MAKKSKSSGGSLRRWKRKLALLVNVVIVVVGAVWYVRQPAERREEVRILLGNYMERKKRISLVEVAYDIWTMYYGDQFVASSFSGGETMVYGGNPVSDGFKHSVRVLPNDGFVVGYSDSMHCPVWVGYRLFDVDGDTTVAERPESFEEDRRTAARVRHKDYSGSGYDRGHMAPNFGIARCYGPDAQTQTFLMSNIVPQTHTLNAGPWKELEMREALNYTGRFREVWVITGPVFSAKPEKLASGVRVPNGCFKIIVDELEGRIRTQAFVMSQDLNGDEDLGSMLTSIDDIERLTGFDFFPALEPAAQEQLEASVASRAW